jgi:hypothetical protein
MTSPRHRSSVTRRRTAARRKTKLVARAARRMRKLKKLPKTPLRKWRTIAKGKVSLLEDHRRTR